jgi:3-(methylthio)propanoyl-CoA dehydrogenase
VTPYAAPISDMRFVMQEVAGLADLQTLPGFEEATPDLVDAALGEAARFASEVLAPLNQSGDREGSRIENGVVRTPAGFKEAYRQFVASGWNSVPFDPVHGGQGLPWLVGMAVNEMWQSANLSFSLCPLLTQGAIELLQAHGSPDQQALWLPRMVKGEWTGTMNLTEPQAGTDLAALRCRALPEGDHYRITGQKIFITFGEHDLAENIVHMLLARTPEAPAGVHGISLFIVPKRLVDPNGRLLGHNDLRAASLEHKLGIHGSPTCVMAYGEDKGAIGYLVGEENHGLEYMFTMMNNARLGVGLQGVSLSERAYQQARAYAHDRVQGRDRGGPAKIIRYPDVRRMLLTMRVQTEALRALAYFTAAALDRARRHPDPARRQREQATVDLLTPVVKALSTDVGVEVASLGVQIHGGMGYVEETGAAQFYRDVRIAPIYEGTNGIQALDLVRRKIARDGGEALGQFMARMAADDAAFAQAPGDDMAVLRQAVRDGLEVLGHARDWLTGALKRNERAALAAASPFLKLFGTVTATWLMARAGLAATRRLADGPADAQQMAAKLITARFYAEQILPPALALLMPITRGEATILALDDDQL